MRHALSEPLSRLLFHDGPHPLDVRLSPWPPDYTGRLTSQNHLGTNARCVPRSQRDDPFQNSIKRLPVTTRGRFFCAFGKELL